MYAISYFSLHEMTAFVILLVFVLMTFFFSSGFAGLDFCPSELALRAILHNTYTHEIDIHKTYTPLMG